MRAKKYMDGGTVKKSFFEEMEDLGNVGKLSSMGRGMSKAEAAEETGRSQARAASGRAAARGDSEPAPVPASTQTFGQAFRAARGRGDRTFEWRGRRYTTEMASAPSQRSVQAPSRQEIINTAEDLQRQREREERVRAAEYPSDAVSRLAQREQAPRREPPRVYTPDAGPEGVEGAMPPASSPNRRPRGPESNLMRTLRRAVHGEERAREMEARGYAKGGHVKKMASGGTCRGMGKATRGGDYKFR